MAAHPLCATFRALALACSFTLAAASSAFAHTHPAHANARTIEFPDLPDHLTLVCDFHQHTVFSDGHVWPTIRVQESERDGLDAIAITDHLEYQPHSADIPHPDRNRAHDLALKEVGDGPLIVIRGAEVTRSLPPGHANAIFIDDANALRVPDPVDAFRAAGRQNAFIFWNHPAWIDQAPDGIARLTPMHEQLLADGLLHGIEVVNEHTYSEEALQIALDRNLTIMGNSDIHGLVDWDHRIPEGGHRPVTLVFAKSKTPAALKEALFARRTVVWFNHTLIGRAEWIDPLLAASLTASDAAYGTDNSVLKVSLTNASDADLVLRNTSPYTFHRHADILTVKAHATETLEIKTRDRLPRVDLTFEVLNAITAPNTHPAVTYTLEPKM